MSEKICPVCNRSNLPNAARCWYCQSLLDDEPVVGEPGAGDQEDQAAAPEVEKEIPDWLARIRARKAIETMEPSDSKPEPPVERKVAEIKPAAPTPSDKPAPSVPSGKTGSISRRPGVELPAWITELEKEVKPAEEEAESFTPPVEKVEDSDWMQKLSAWQKEDEPEEGAAEKAQPDTTPEWLAEFLSNEPPSKPEGTSITAEEFNAKVQTTEPKAGDTEPLGQLDEAEEAMRQDETYDFSVEAELELKKAEEEIPPLDESELEAGFTPLSVELPSESAAPSTKTPQEPVEEDDLDLTWLEEFKQSAAKEPPPAEEEKQPEEESTRPLAPFLGVQEHDWSTQPVVPEEKAGETGAGEGEASQPELPIWMQQLRQIESSAPAEPVKPEESSVTEGPLAGIQGALQTSELPDLYTKPPIYTNKIQVTERQSIRADLLSNIVQEIPPDAVAAGEKPVAAPRSRLMRILVGLLILAVVFMVLVAAPGTSLLPVLYPPETANAYQLVNNLGSDKPVLVAADFDAGLSGEIGFTSQALIEHLMLRNVPLAFLSTNPAGSALMSGMLTSAQVKVTSFDLSTRTVQFGYLAGGSVALQTLASDVRTALPYTAELMPAWDNALLQNVSSLSDFGALVVLTDDADTGRYWVEQVQPALGGIPLIMVTSAQSAPMLLPYYESGQVNGVVAGMSGGSAYEQILNLPGQSTFYFGAYQSLLLVVMMLILIGGVIALVLPGGIRRKA